MESAATDDYTTNYRDIYAASIDYLDRIISDLIAQIQSKSKRPTTILITSDHGENLGYDADEGFFDHTSSLSEGLLHVPFTVVNPPDRWDVYSEDKYFSHIYLRDLIVAAAQENPIDSDWFGKTCAAEIVGMSGIGFGERSVSEKDEKYWNRMIRCYYNQNKKYVWDSLGNQKLYHIDQNTPCKQRSISSTSEDFNLIFDESKSFFDTEIIEYKNNADKNADEPDIGSEMKSRLKDLGYM